MSGSNVARSSSVLYLLLLTDNCFATSVLRCHCSVVFILWSMRLLRRWKIQLKIHSSNDHSGVSWTMDKLSLEEQHCIVHNATNTLMVRMCDSSARWQLDMYWPTYMGSVFVGCVQYRLCACTNDCLNIFFHNYNCRWCRRFGILCRISLGVFFPSAASHLGDHHWYVSYHGSNKGGGGWWGRGW